MNENILLEQLAQLTENQRNQIIREIKDYIQMNDSLKSTRPTLCPCCNKEARFIKRGKLRKTKKQRYSCKECGHKFVYDSKTVTSCMKISQDEFIEICVDTLALVPVLETAARLNRTHKCIFLNRHKFLTLLEEFLNRENQTLSGTIEIDETYVLDSQKGITPTHRKARHRGEPSNYRGISHEQICLVTTTDRNAHEIFKAVGYAKPTSNIITDTFSERICEKSIIYSDGASCYDQLSEKTNCRIKHLKTNKSYNKVEHLNTVNCIHSIIKDAIKQYRGVSAKYINRYSSMFVFYRRYQGMDQNEITENVIRTIKLFFHTVRRSNISSYKTFPSLSNI